MFCEVPGDFLGFTIKAIDPLPYVGRSIMVVGLDTIKVGIVNLGLPMLDVIHSFIHSVVRSFNQSINQ